MINYKNIFLLPLLLCSTVNAAEDKQPGLSKIPSIAGAPDLSVSDGANVNLLSGLPTISQTDNSIGSGVGAMTHTLSSYDAGYLWGFSDNLYIDLAYWDNSFGLRVTLPGKSPERFYYTPDSGGYYQPVKKNGSTLRLVQTIGTEKYYEYISNDGTVLKNNTDGTSTLIYPNGLTYYYSSVDQYISGVKYSKYKFVKNNAGFAFAYVYDLNTYTDIRKTFPKTIFGYNLAVESCNTSSLNCGFTKSWRTSEYSWPAYNEFFTMASYPNATAEKDVVVSDYQGIKTFYRHKSISIASPNNLNLTSGISYQNDLDGLPKMLPRLMAIYVGSTSIAPVKKYEYQNFIQEFPGDSPGATKSIRYEIRNLIALKSTVNEQVWTYNHNQPNTIYRKTGEAIGPYGRINVTMLYQGGSSPDLVGTIRNPDMEINYNENAMNLARQVNKDGQLVTFEYDSRGNITRRITKGADGVSELLESATYDAICSNPKKCNKPNSITDKNGNTTDLEYHAESGQVQRITYPADRNGVRPETRYYYEQKYAFYKNDNGSLTAAPSPIWMLVKTSECLSSSATTSGCSKLNDEIVTTFDYGPSNQPNNLLVRGVAVTFQGVTRRTCYSYDEYGNKVSEIDANAQLQSCY